MRWVRANRRWGGRLALIALALQSVLAFAHVHVEDFVAQNHGSVAIGAPTAPDDSPSGAAHGDCAICNTIQLLRTAVDSAPPLLAPPCVVAYELSLRAPAPRATPFAPALFQARAPPLA